MEYVQKGIVLDARQQYILFISFWVTAATVNLKDIACCFPLCLPQVLWTLQDMLRSPHKVDMLTEHNPSTEANALHLKLRHFVFYFPVLILCLSRSSFSSKLQDLDAIFVICFPSES